MRSRLVATVLCGVLLASAAACGKSEPAPVSPGAASGAAGAAQGGHDDDAEPPRAAANPMPLLERFYAAVSKGDWDAAGALLSEDVHWACAGCGRTDDIGRGEVIQHFKTLRASVPDLALSVERSLRPGPHEALHQVTLRGSHKGQAYHGLEAKGHAVGYRELAFVQAQRGALARVVTYGNTMAIAMQMAPEAGARAPKVPEAPAAEAPDQVEAEGVEANVALVKRALDGISKGEDAVFDEVCHAEVIAHSLADGRTLAGIDQQKQAVGEMRGAFPDLSVDIDEIRGAGQWVVARYRFKGTHKGKLGPVDPTERTIDVAAADLVRVEGGKIIELTTYIDAGQMMTQLGLLESVTKATDPGEPDAGP